MDGYLHREQKSKKIGEFYKPIQYLMKQAIVQVNTAQAATK
jgi:hypothetical protein